MDKISRLFLFMIILYIVITFTVLCIFGNYFLIKNPYIILSLFAIALILFILTTPLIDFMNDKEFDSDSDSDF